MNVKRIVIIGPESTGKSTLCKQLAQHYNTTWCPEYAREYLLQHGMQYTFEDLLTIAKGQWKLDNDITTQAGKQNAPFVFVDTDQYVMKVWCEFVFGKCHSWITRRAAEQQAAMYLLCDTDLPWTKDELREYPDHASRQKLFCYYKDILVNDSTPWALVNGSETDRLNTAIHAIEKQFGFSVEQAIIPNRH
jgi:NadR type nicotinamide-nucleotide adenylyltransferase